MTVERVSREEGMLEGGGAVVLSEQTQTPEHLSSHGDVQAVLGELRNVLSRRAR